MNEFYRGIVRFEPVVIPDMTKRSRILGTCQKDEFVEN